MPEPLRTPARDDSRIATSRGLLLTTIRIDHALDAQPNLERGEDARRSLESLDMRDIQFAIWQEDYSQVWARKAGASEPIGAGARERVMRA